MRKLSSIGLILIVGMMTGLRAQQIAISRVELMPNLPSPYLMRDWKKLRKGTTALSSI